MQYGSDFWVMNKFLFITIALLFANIESQGVGNIGHQIYIDLNWTPGISWLLGDLHKRGTSNGRYRLKDLPNYTLSDKIVIKNPSIGLKYIPRYEPRFYAGAIFAFGSHRLFASDYGTDFHINGIRNLTTEVAVSSKDIGVYAGVLMFKTICLEIGIGRGVGKAVPRISGPPEMIDEFTEKGAISDTPITYGYTPITLGLQLPLFMRKTGKSISPPTMVFGLKMKFFWRATDGIDGYYYVAQNDLGGGKDSYATFVVNVSFNVTELNRRFRENISCRVFENSGKRFIRTYGS